MELLQSHEQQLNQRGNQFDEQDGLASLILASAVVVVTICHRLVFEDFLPDIVIKWDIGV